MLATILDTVFNGLLISTSGYALYKLQPAVHPFAFTASSMALCHGCVGIYKTFFKNKSEDTPGKCLNRVNIFTSSCLEIITVPLINMDFYRSSQQANALALGHGLFIIPLAFDLTFRVFRAGDTEDEATAVLKDLTVLGNIVSLWFYAINEDNLPAGMMAMAAFLAYYGSIIMDTILPGTGENTSLAAYALFLGLMPKAIEAVSSVTAAN